VQEKGPYRLRDRAAARLGAGHDLASVGAEMSGEERRERALAAALGAFQGDEEAAAGVTSNE
jgi:hypothetical protein